MTTAARPTFDHAKGKAKGKRSHITHARELPQHTEIKYRHKGTKKNLDFESDDEEIEEQSEEDDDEYDEFGELRKKRTKFNVPVESVEELKSEFNLRRSTKEEEDVDNGFKTEKTVEAIIKQEIDAEAKQEEGFDIGSGSESESGGEDNSDDYESEDDSEDEEALLEELNKIKRERAEAKEREEEEKLIERSKVSNPLLTYQDQDNEEDEQIETKPDINSLESRGTSNGNTKIKKSWRDEAVFSRRNRKSGDDGMVNAINDMLRNDYHKKFLNKYMK